MRQEGSTIEKRMEENAQAVQENKDIGRKKEEVDLRKGNILLNNRRDLIGLPEKEKEEIRETVIGIPGQ